MAETSVSKECDCPVPADHKDFHAGFRDGWCRNCGRKLNPDWLSTDENFNRFFDHLAATPGVHPEFVEHCRRRELAGRPEFGCLFLDRENEIEGCEEVADFANYMMFSLLRRRREGRHENTAKALEAARHAAIAHRLALELASED